jgi:ribosome maturation factor RimP
MTTFEDIRAIIENKLTELGLELYDIHHAKSGRHSLLRIYIDKEGGVTIDDCERASHALSLLLDVEEFSSTPYRLEVSSPGAERVLKSERDFTRAKGQRVRVHHRSGADAKILETHGIVQEYANGNLVLRTLVTKQRQNSEQISIPITDIQHAKLELEF